MSSSKPYLLPCDCSARIPVGPGQAGGRVSCPSCGSLRSVPRLGELTRLEVAAEPPQRPAARQWTWLHAVTLAGVVVALLAIAAAQAIDLLNGAATRSFLDPDVIRASMQAADAVETYRGWQAFSQSGIRRAPLAVELKLERLEQSSGRVATVFRGIALLGVAVAVGGAAGLLASRRDGEAAR